MAFNRYYSATKYYSRATTLAQNITCIFLSHQQKDKEQARKIADFLIRAGIDVYFDEYDADLKLHHQSNNAKAVTEAIKKGINNSSHMLVIVSPHTMYSTWVPFEVGYGHDKTDLNVLCLKGIQKGHLPEYLKTSTILRDIYDLNKFISKTTKQAEVRLMSEHKIYSYDESNHPLSTVMDSLINER